MATDLDARVAAAVRLFWATRRRQAARQGRSGPRDAGARAAVTGGRQMSGFVGLVRDVLTESGVPGESVHTDAALELPGWFRAEKKWDLIVVHRGELVAAVEFKSQVGPSFGNNFNNRTEEALGSATDLWAAFREGAFRPSARPWLGYVMLLESCPASSRPVATSEPHFGVFPEFRGASYQRRYGVLIEKLVRERLYDAACLLVSDAAGGARSGASTQPLPELTMSNLLRGLRAKVIAHLGT
jgi:hypothetical protein